MTDDELAAHQRAYSRADFFLNQALRAEAARAAAYQAEFPTIDDLPKPDALTYSEYRDCALTARALDSGDELTPETRARAAHLLRQMVRDMHSAELSEWADRMERD